MDAAERPSATKPEPQSSVPTGHKDLQYLVNLPRSPLWSYLRKQAEPARPVPKGAASRPIDFPALAAFASTKIFRWIPEYVIHRIGRRHKFLTYPASDPGSGVYQLNEGAEETRVALAGDWASGTDEAASVANHIALFDPHYTIHLGDVYYVGGRNETGENFLGIDNPHNHYTPCRWPAGSLGSFALNGNHEMYALGKAYFDEMLPALGAIKGGQPQGQRASFFCLENEHWRIIALDTGYKSIGLPVLEYFWPPDCGLPAGVLQWLRKIVHGDRRATILLSHHNYFSRYETVYPRQAVQLKEFFAEHPVLWFWGHEHRLVIYKEYRLGGGISALGRCIGHGGMPIELPKEVKDSNCPVEFEDSRRYPNDENLTVGYNGFVTLVLRGDQLEVRYIDVFGDTVFSEQWSGRDGVLTRTGSGVGVAASVR
jgi:hypothetical protein